MKELIKERQLNLQYSDFNYYLNKALYNEELNSFLNYFNKISYKLNNFPDIKINISFFQLMIKELKLQNKDIEMIKKIIFNSLNFLYKKQINCHAVIIAPLDKSLKITNNLKNWNKEFFLLRIVQTGEEKGVFKSFKSNLDSIIKSFNFKSFKYIKSDTSVFYDSIFKFNKQIGQTEEKK